MTKTLLERSLSRAKTVRLSRSLKQGGNCLIFLILANSKVSSAISSFLGPHQRRCDFTARRRVSPGISMLLHVLFLAIGATMVLPRCLTFPLERKVINAIKDSDYLCIILWLPDVESAKASQWTTGLPFPVQVWTHLRGQHIQMLKDYTASNREVVVVLPSSSDQQRTALLEGLGEDIMFIPLVRLLFVLKDRGSIPNDNLGDVSCIVIFVNETIIDAPEDSYKNCSKRTTTDADKIFKTEKTRGWNLLKGKSVIGYTKYLDKETGSNFDYNHTAYGPTLVDALEYINVTVIQFTSDTPYKKYPHINQALQDMLHKKVDISCIPSIYDEIDANVTYTSAVTHMGTIFFYTAKGRIRPATLILGSGTLQVSWYLATLAAVILAIHFLQGRIRNCPTNVSSVALLLYAFIFGQYPDPPSPLRNTVTSMLLCFWSVGVAFLSSYIQSDFTSETSVPGISKSIETLDQLEHLVKLKQVRPCVTSNLYIHQLIRRTQVGILGAFRNSLLECGDGCIQHYGGSKCIENARRGTHVFVFIETKSVPEHMFHEGLWPGTENLGTKPVIFMTSKTFPYRQEHHRIVRVITETALYVPFRKKLNHTVDEEIAIPLTEMLGFRIIFLLSCGCCMSLVVLIFEVAIFWKASLSNKHN